jgi:hypothetical protein
MAAVVCKDGKVEIGLNSMLNGILSAGGVGALRDQIKAKENEGED